MIRDVDEAYPVCKRASAFAYELKTRLDIGLNSESRYNARGNWNVLCGLCVGYCVSFREHAAFKVDDMMVSVFYV